MNHKPIFCKLLVILMSLITAQIAYSQSLNIQQASLTYESDSLINTNGVFTISLPDSNSIAQLELSIGSKVDSVDVFNSIVGFDQTSGLPAGVTYYRTGLEIMIEFSELPKHDFYYCRTRLIGTNNSYGPYYQFLAN